MNISKVVAKKAANNPVNNPKITAFLVSIGSVLLIAFWSSNNDKPAAAGIIRQQAKLFKGVICKTPAANPQIRVAILFLNIFP